MSWKAFNFTLKMKLGVQSTKADLGKHTQYHHLSPRTEGLSRVCTTKETTYGGFGAFSL